MKKYKMIEEGSMFRLKALKDFADVKKGDVGGLIEKEANLSQDGNCWVYKNAKVYEDAQVSGNAKVSGDVRVFGRAWILGDIQVSGDIEIAEDAWIYGNAKVSENNLKGGEK